MESSPIVTAVVAPVTTAVVVPVTGQPSGAAIIDAYAVAGFSPELVFDFAEDYYRTSGSDATFADSITHARASNATMVDTDGLLKWAPHNLLTYSEQFDNASWSKASGVTVTANTDVAPDGTTTADTVTSGANQITQSVSCLQNTVYTDSLFFKKTTGATYTPGLYLLFSGGTLVIYAAAINTDTGDYTVVTAGGFTTPLSVSVSDAGAYWRLSISGNSGNNTAVHLRMYPNINPVSSGVGPGSQIIWGAHLYRSDLGGMVDNPDRGDSYVPTTSSARYLPRRGYHVYNGSAWVNEGLLVESEARTNVAYYSNDISETTTGWTANSTLTAPATGITGIDGVSGSPFKLIAGSSGNVQFVENKNNVTTGQDYAICAILKDAGDGVYASLIGLGIGAASEVPVFDLVNGTVDVAATTTVVKEAGIYPWGNDGWYFCWARVTAGGIAGVHLGVNNSATDNNSTGYVWTGDDTSGYYVAYVGCEQTSGMPSIMPIPTSGSTVTRAADSLTVPSANLPWPTPEVIGEELVTNGTFDTDLDGWTVSPDWSWSNGKAVDSGTSALNYLSQTITTTSGSVYLVTLDVSNLTGGTPAIDVNGSTLGSLITENGSHSRVFVASSTSTIIRFYGAFALWEIDNISVKEINPLALSIQMDGEMTYADEFLTEQAEFVVWQKDVNNRIALRLNTASGAGGGSVRFLQEATNVLDFLDSSPDTYSPGTNVPYNIASRHGSTFINGAVDGTALTADTTPTALPDLSATDLQLAYDYMGTIKTFRMWADDLGDEGIAIGSATAPVITGLPAIGVS